MIKAVYADTEDDSTIEVMPGLNGDDVLIEVTVEDQTTAVSLSNEDVVELSKILYMLGKGDAT